MENKPSPISDIHILGLAGVFLGWASLAKIQEWFGAWIKVPNHRFLLALLTTLAILALAIFLYRCLTVTRAKHVHEKSILGPGEFAVYCGTSSKSEPVFIKPKQRIMHTQVVGTTNSGKTESVILPWAIQDIQQGRGLLLIDGKADRDLLNKLWAYTVEAGRENDFRLFSLGSIEKSQTFNPLVGGSAEEITERIFSAFTFENPFYRSLQYEVLAQTLRIFEAASEIPTFLKLHQAISNPSHLERLCENSNVPALYSWVMHLKNLSGADRDQRTSGLTSQISHFAFGRSSSLFNAEEPAITVEQALASNQIVYFQLPVLLSPFLGAATGKLVLQSLQSAIAKRHRGSEHRKFFSVFLDDFSEYLYPGFVSVLNKSRSANVGIVFAHQALGDIESLGDSVANSILTNSSLKVFMRGNDPDSAEHFAKVIGTKSTVKMTERRKISLFQDQGTGDVSARDVEEFIVHPNCFKRELGVGEAIIIVPHERGSKALRIKFDKYPDLPFAPMPERVRVEAIGLAEKHKSPRKNEHTIREVLQIQQKEPTCTL